MCYPVYGMVHINFNFLVIPRGGYMVYSHKINQVFLFQVCIVLMNEQI